MKFVVLLLMLNLLLISLVQKIKRKLGLLGFFALRTVSLIVLFFSFFFYVGLHIRNLGSFN